MITLNHIRPKNPGVITNKGKSKAYNPPTNPQENPEYPIPIANCFRGTVEITPSDRTAINPLKEWVYGGPGLKSRRPDELKPVKTCSGVWG